MFRNNSVIYLSVQFPLTTYMYMGSFTPYKVMSFPVPINSSNNHASQLLDLPVYLLISADKTFNTILSEKTISQCQRTNQITHCFQKPNLWLIDNCTNCVLNVVLANPHNIKFACNFRFLMNALKPHIIQISDTQLLSY